MEPIVFRHGTIHLPDDFPWIKAPRLRNSHEDEKIYTLTSLGDCRKEVPNVWSRVKSLRIRQAQLMREDERNTDERLEAFSWAIRGQSAIEHVE